MSMSNGTVNGETRTRFLNMYSTKEAYMESRKGSLPRSSREKNKSEIIPDNKFLDVLGATPLASVDQERLTMITDQKSYYDRSWLPEKPYSVDSKVSAIHPERSNLIENTFSLTDKESTCVSTCFSPETVSTCNQSPETTAFNAISKNNIDVLCHIVSNFSWHDNEISYPSTRKVGILEGDKIDGLALSNRCTHPFIWISDAMKNFDCYGQLEGSHYITRDTLYDETDMYQCPTPNHFCLESTQGSNILSAATNFVVGTAESYFSGTDFSFSTGSVSRKANAGFAYSLSKQSENIGESHSSDENTYGDVSFNSKDLRMDSFLKNVDQKSLTKKSTDDMGKGHLRRNTPFYSDFLHSNDVWEQVYQNQLGPAETVLLRQDSCSIKLHSCVNCRKKLFGYVQQHLSIPFFRYPQPKFVLKILARDYVIGSLIGRKGSRICLIKRYTRSRILISQNYFYFQGTRFRCIVLESKNAHNLTMACSLVFAIILRGNSDFLDSLSLQSWNKSCTNDRKCKECCNAGNGSLNKMGLSPFFPPTLYPVQKQPKSDLLEKSYVALFEFSLCVVLPIKVLKVLLECNLIPFIARATGTLIMTHSHTKASFQKSVFDLSDKTSFECVSEHVITVVGNTVDTGNVLHVLANVVSSICSPHNLDSYSQAWLHQ